MYVSADQSHLSTALKVQLLCESHAWFSLFTQHFYSINSLRSFGARIEWILLANELLQHLCLCQLFSCLLIDSKQSRPFILCDDRMFEHNVFTSGMDGTWLLLSFFAFGLVIIFVGSMHTHEQHDAVPTAYLISQRVKLHLRSCHTMSYYYNVYLIIGYEWKELYECPHKLRISVRIHEKAVQFLGQHNALILKEQFWHF